MIKKGDTVRVLRNMVHARKVTDYSKQLKSGDLVVVAEVQEKMSRIIYHCYPNVNKDPSQGLACYIPLDDIELVLAVPDQDGCSCSITTLTSVGCQCGAIQRERQP